MAAGIVVVLVSATGIIAWQAIRPTRAGRLAFDRVAEIAAERDAKDQARKEAEAVSIFLSEEYQSPDPARNGRAVAETLDAAARKRDTVLDSQPGHRATLARTCCPLGLFRVFIPRLEKARDYFHTACGPRHFTTCSAIHNLAVSNSKAGRGATAPR